MLLTWLSMVPAAGAQSPRATIAALWRGAESAQAEPLRMTRHGEVCHVRNVDLAKISRVALGDPLMPGDILSLGPCPGEGGPPPGSETGRAPDLLVELSCGEGTVLRLADRFEVLILEADGEDCAVDLAQGTADVLTDRPAEITSGGVTIGVEGTRFTLENDGRSPTRQIRCSLFKGRVQVETGPLGTAPAGRSFVLEAGEAWSLAGDETERGTLDPADVSAAAARSARLAVARAFAQNGCSKSLQERPPHEIASRLEPLYLGVLSDPADLDAQTSLGRALLELGLTSEAPELREPEPFGDASSIQKLRLATELGMATVSLPRDLRRGELISGFLEVTGAGKGRSKEENLEKLSRFQVKIGQEALPLRPGPWSLRLPAVGARLSVVLQNRRGRRQVEKAVDLSELGSGGTLPAFTAPPVCPAGWSAEIPGPFDGESGTTQAFLGSAEVPILAETARGLTIACPESLAGRQPLSVVENGEAFEVSSFSVIGLDFEVLKQEIKRGEISAATLRIFGLEGFDHPLSVKIRNENPRIVRLEGGDEQILTFFPSDWEAGGSVVRTFQVVGRRQGKTQFSIGWAVGQSGR